MAYTTRGFWGSEGVISVASEGDIQDVSSAITYMKTFTPVDDRIGTAGISYGAGMSLLASARDARIRALAALSGGGRIVVMAYQSLEDKIVKSLFAAATASRTPPGLPMELPGYEAEFVSLTRGAEQADADEIELNPRSAPVRLRALEKVAGKDDS